jgi:hypothetical protein
MDFYRTKDYDAVRLILTDPNIYPWAGDDSLPPVDEFQVNEHPGIWYVMVAQGDCIVGMFVLIPENTVCWQVHVNMLCWAKTREKWQAARELIPWIRENTQCKRLTASIPEFNRRALIYGTHGLGMRYVGRQAKAFLHGGELRDLIILGMSVNGSVT